MNKNGSKSSDWIRGLNSFGSRELFSMPMACEHLALDAVWRLYLALLIASVIVFKSGTKSALNFSNRLDGDRFSYSTQFSEKNGFFSTKKIWSKLIKWIWICGRSKYVVKLEYGYWHQIIIYYYFCYIFLASRMKFVHFWRMNNCWYEQKKRKRLEIMEYSLLIALCFTALHPLCDVCARTLRLYVRSSSKRGEKDEKTKRKSL